MQRSGKKQIIPLPHPKTIDPLKMSQRIYDHPFTALNGDHLRSYVRAARRVCLLIREQK